MNNKARRFQGYLALSFYLLSGQAIFCPIYKSQNPAVSLFFAFITGMVSILFCSRIFTRKTASNIKSKLGYGILSVLSAVLSVFISLVLATEVIRDVTYIAGRGVNLTYYILLGTAILGVSYYLCYNSEKGIFRFSIPSVLIFVLLLSVIPTAFLTVKGAVVNENLFSINGGMFSSAVIGIISGLMISIDVPAFFTIFKGYITDGKGQIPAKIVTCSFITAFIFLIIQYGCALLVFGKNLTVGLDYPLFALIKLSPLGDVTELLTAAKITAFMIKSSVYSYCCAKCLFTAFFKGTKALTRIMTATYLVIPILFFVLTIMQNGKQYGSLQHLIYPATALFSLLICFLDILRVKKSE